MCLPPGATAEMDLSWLDFSGGADLSEDGKTMLFDEWGSASGGAGAVYLRKTDGSDPVRLGDGLACALSPDGKWAISISARKDRLILLPTGPGEPRVMQDAALSYDSAKFFPGGTRVLFSASASGHPTRLYVQEVTGGAPRPLTPEGFAIGPVSPDGKLVATRGPDKKVVLYPVEGGAPRPMPGLDGEDTVIRWDGKGEALFLARGSAPVRIDRFDLATGRREHWLDVPAGTAFFESIQLTPDGKSYAYSTFRMATSLYVVDGLR